MPRLITFMVICLAIYMIGLELSTIYDYLKPLPWKDWLPLMAHYRQLIVARVIGSKSMMPYLIAALVVGTVEGLSWRSKQVWRGYHRSVWQLSGVSIILAIALFVSWSLALKGPGTHRLWAACILLIPASFTMSAGYKASTVR